MKILGISLIILMLGFSGVAFAEEERYQDDPDVYIDDDTTTSETGGGGIVPVCDGPCGFCDFFKLISNIINFITFRFAPIVGALLFVYGGIMMIISAGDPGRFQAAKKIFWSTVVGLVIIYGAWLITNSLLKSIAKDDVSNSWYQIECSTKGSTSSRERGTLPTGGDDTSSDDRLTAAEKITRNQLYNNGIHINKSECPAGVSYQGVPGGCTNVGGLKSKTVEGIIKLKNNCDCPVIITGGSEPGHSSGEFSHESGYKVDLGRNLLLDSHIVDNYPFIGLRSDGAEMYKDPKTGTIYSKEGDHWDVKT